VPGGIVDIAGALPASQRRCEPPALLKARRTPRKTRVTRFVTIQHNHQKDLDADFRRHDEPGNGLSGCVIPAKAGAFRYPVLENGNSPYVLNSYRVFNFASLASLRFAFSCFFDDISGASL
jgi:hypothetical protein